jgi:hypothetical protein
MVKPRPDDIEVAKQCALLKEHGLRVHILRQGIVFTRRTMTPRGFIDCKVSIK